MKFLASWAPCPNLAVLSVARGGQSWIVSVVVPARPICPICGAQSQSRHSVYWRTLHDLAAQGTEVTIRARLARWRCRNTLCERLVFAERAPELAARFARRTTRLAEIVRMFGYSSGGLPSERLLARLGMPVSDTTILRCVKQLRAAGPDPAPLRIAGIDEWAWRKGMTFGTIVVDLERREVVAVLTDRSAGNTAEWLAAHPEIEIISRDRAGLYADAARQGAPQARQVADRFHLLKNFRETIERQLDRFETPIRAGIDALSGEECDAPADPDSEAATAPAPSEIVAYEPRPARKRTAVQSAVFDEVRVLYDAGISVVEIARRLGIGRRRTYRWVRRLDLPERNVMAPKPSTPAYFEGFLKRSWAEGTTKIRYLLLEIRKRGYTGSFSHLARFLAPWRVGTAPDGNLSAKDEEAPAASIIPVIDPATGRRISALTAAALCVKPRGAMTERQIANVDALKAASADFVTMRGLALRFRGLLRGGTAEKLDAWVADARKSGIYGMQRFARTLRQDIEAVRNTVLEPWSNGQTEGQINRLKTLKRSMYGRAGVELLRARMLPI
jgi:transposase